MSVIIYTRAETNNELNQILKLQQNNIPSEISEDEKILEGFVTVNHTFEVLQAMNNKCPHIVAKRDNLVVGYALCMLKDFKEEIEVLKPMFKQIDRCLNDNQSYIVMGQICIDKLFRRQGVFRGLYNYMRDIHSSKFDLIITEVDNKNARSMNAHIAIGFKILYSYRSNSHDWNILYLNTTN